MSELGDRIKARITEQGPISVAEYMAQCLLDPTLGYYPTRDPLGSDGDFITAPEISQMFGEVIGLWCIQSWHDMGRPQRLNLVELGPGRGVMMSDILRTASLDKGFRAALSVTLIEASAALEAVQAKTLASAGVSVNWAKDLSEVPPEPTLIIGNEFLDCLPIRQFIQKDIFAGRAGWHERLVALDKNDRLSFGFDPIAISATVQAELPAEITDARLDDLLEISPSARQIIDQIASRFAEIPGRALFIDYGPETTEFGDSLQALKRHKKVGVFSDPGNTDLTARVDFAALQEMAQAQDLALNLPVTNAVPQRIFLSKLGIEMRAVALSKSSTNPDTRAKIARQLHRLMDSAEMGDLFKAICFQSGGLPLPLGFDKLL